MSVEIQTWMTKEDVAKLLRENVPRGGVVRLAPGKHLISVEDLMDVACALTTAPSPATQPQRK